MKQADLAMYKSKASGRNIVRFFDPALELAVKEVSLLRMICARLAEKQFELHYQPQVVGEGLVTGAEVLLRWQHPNGAWYRRRVHSNRRGIRTAPAPGLLGAGNRLQAVEGVGRAARHGRSDAFSECQCPEFHQKDLWIWFGAYCMRPAPIPASQA